MTWDYLTFLALQDEREANVRGREPGSHFAALSFMGFDGQMWVVVEQ